MRVPTRVSGWRVPIRRPGGLGVAIRLPRGLGMAARVPRRPGVAMRPSRGRRLSAASGAFAILVLALSGAALAGCGGGAAGGGSSMPAMTPASGQVGAGGSAGGTAGGGAAPGMIGGPGMTAGPTADVGPGMTAGPTAAAGQAGDAAIEAAWAARPDYVRHADAPVAEAYRFALERPDVIQWMPCYCGCAEMGHESNLDCFLRSRMPGGAVAYEEHASYCDICVDTALLAKRRILEGRSLAEIRAEVDRTIGANGVTGTPTDLPQG